MREINRVGLLIAFATSIACLSVPSRAAEAPAGAATPSDAIVRMAQAMADGDEAGFRNVVVYRTPSAYAEALARAQIAAAQLHRAVREHGVTSKRVRDAGFDRNQRLLANAPPTGKELEQALKAYRAIQWEIDGNVARIAPPPPGPDGKRRPAPPNPIRVERLPGRGWVVVSTDAGTQLGDNPIDPAVKAHVDSARISAEVFEAATAKVKAGELKTVLAVNEFITAERDAVAERAVAAMRAAPPSGPVIVVTDADTGEPVAGAKVSARFTVPPATTRHLSETTGADGRTRLPAEPDSIHELTVTAEGYARQHKLLPAASKPAADGQPAEHHVTIGKPAVIEITLEFPDDRRMAISVYEGSADDPSPAALREQLAKAGPRVVRVEFKDEPPPLPKHHPLTVLRLHQSEKGRTDPDGVSYRVSRARVAGTGKELPVFRDGPPEDPKTVGVYVIGTNGLANTVMVVGTLADARAVDAQDDVTLMQGNRNKAVLGKRSAPATSRRSE